MEIFDRAWTGIKGAAKYVAAIERGDIAPDDAASARVRLECRHCSAVHVQRGVISGQITAWCGRPLVDGTGVDVPVPSRTCGCIVGYIRDDDRVLVSAQPTGEARRSFALQVLQPAGKTRVASEACPRRRWGPVCPSGCGRSRSRTQGRSFEGAVTGP